MPSWVPKKFKPTRNNRELIKDCFLSPLLRNWRRRYVNGNAPTRRELGSECPEIRAGRGRWNKEGSLMLSEMCSPRGYCTYWNWNFWEWLTFLIMMMMKVWANNFESPFRIVLWNMLRRSWLQWGIKRRLFAHRKIIYNGKEVGNQILRVTC